MLTCVGYVVGLGNIWRFPYLAYAYGGGAFLVPYFILNFVIGLPLVVIESAPAQFSGRGPQGVWLCVPFLKGCGLASVMLMFLVAIPFCTVYTWAWYYMFASFTANLPWATCGNDYNTPNCIASLEAQPCMAQNGTWYNMTCYNASMAEQMNLTDFFNNTLPGLRTPATQEFFDRSMYNLDRINTISNLGNLKWDLVLTSLFSWTLSFLCIIKGIQSVGKVVYFTALFPYVIITIMLVRGLTLDGAEIGVSYYTTPQWNMITDVETWAQAAAQIVFSLALGVGGMMTFSSYNQLDNNLIRDSLIIVTINGLTSFFAGFAVFAILGFMAKELNVDITQVANAESGLAFITYPEVVTRLTPAPFWSCLFFFMLILVALDSVITGLEVLQTAILDTYPHLRAKKTYIAMGLCIFLFVITLPECTMGGYYLEELINWYVVTFSLVVTILVEVLALAYFYGATRICDDIALMLGKPGWWSLFRWYMVLLWFIVCPIGLALIFVITCITFVPIEFGTGPLPEWAYAIGWMSGLCTLMAFPIGAVHSVYASYKDPQYEGSVWQRIRQLLKPHKDWGPRTDGNLTKKSKDAESAFDNPAFAGNGDTRF